MDRPRPAAAAFLARLLILALLAEAHPAAAKDAQGTRANVRPFVGLGYSNAAKSGEIGEGFGASFGVEVEAWRRTSLLFRAEWNRLANNDPFDSLYPDYIPTATTWSLGARVHARPQTMIRPYGEVCLGVRAFARGSGDSYAGLDGMASTFRLGIAAGKAGDFGMFADAGYELLTSHLDHGGLVPVRFGVNFP